MWRQPGWPRGRCRTPDGTGHRRGGAEGVTTSVTEAGSTGGEAGREAAAVAEAVTDVTGGATVTMKGRGVMTRDHQTDERTIADM